MKERMKEKQKERVIIILWPLQLLICFKAHVDTYGSIYSRYSTIGFNIALS